VANTDIPAFFLDRKLMFLRFTPAAGRLMGLIPGDIGRPVSDTSARKLGPELTKQVQHVLDKHSPTKREVRIGERRGLRWVRPFRTADKTVAGVVVTFIDITEPKEAQDALRASEEQLRRRTGEFSTANAELEAFAYSVSHDLRAPLRTVTGFSEFLLDDYSDKLDETGQAYLQRIIAGSKRMGALIEDMLKLSRISRQDMDIADIDLAAMAHSILAELREKEPDREVDVVIAPELKVKGDATLLRIALTNLLSNAWKCTGKTEHPHIEFGTIDNEGETVLFVSDNGAGFEMKHRERLFQPFQRLHGEQEFAGTGIGLPIVQRVVRRHGGRIWAEGRPGQGASFYFTL
jgi:light-regulated signal transduction histidine kinase (bacteriophytochrome)